MRRLKSVREIYDKFMDVLRDIDIDSLPYAEMEQVARICSTVKILGEKTFMERYVELYGDKCCSGFLGNDIGPTQETEKLSD